MATDKIKKILFFFDSRATFSYANNIIKVFKKKKRPFKILVSGNYLEKISKIDSKIFKKNKLKINYKIKFGVPTNKVYTWASVLGESITRYSKVLNKIKPELVVLTGDRIETLAFCITCSYMNIPLAHVQAGDKSGHIDDLARGAIAKFAHIHFAPSKDACKRLKNWGEKKNRIFFTGAPQLDDIKKKKVKIKNFYVVIYHPILNEQKNLKNQLSSLLKAIKETDLNVIWIYPNTDMGFKSVISILKKSKNKKIKIISNLERSEFLDILNQSSGIIGNSSAGIIEASIFKKPVINIGNRQNERPQSCNIVNCDNNKKDIIKKINFVKKNKKFLNNLNSCKNPYYRKNSSEIIYRIINSLKKNDKIFNKY